MSALPLVAVALLATVGGGLALYWLVAAETRDRPVTDRRSAERTARRDADDPRDRVPERREAAVRSYRSSQTSVSTP